jgi:divalent metal cation (Fe/Co/Zn/Cd) transporter
MLPFPRSTMSTPHAPPVEQLRAAYRVSVMSLSWTITASSAAIVAGVLAHALVLIVFGLTGILDAAGSATLALHFRHALKHDVISAKKERAALRVVSVGLVSIGLFTIEESARKLLGGSHARSSAFGIGITAASIVALTLLTVRKRVVSTRVGSRALLADSYLSATGAGLAAIAVGGTVLAATVNVPWVDPVTALVVALLAAAAGAIFMRGEESSLEDEVSR